jgi:hypothetical protein
MQIESIRSNRDLLPPSNVGVSTPTHQDVLNGKSACIARHPGNDVYCSLIQDHCLDFWKAEEGKKEQVIEDIIVFIRRSKGRFLDTGKSDLWYEIGDKEARKKVRNALIYKAQKIDDPTSSGQKATFVDLKSTVGDFDLLPPSKEGVVTINDTDVIDGNDALAQKHPGNKQFHKIISLHHQSYLNATDAHKKCVCAEIINFIRSSNGRFLCRDKDKCTGLWFEIGDERARKKARLALTTYSARQRKKKAFKLFCPNKQKDYLRVEPLWNSNHKEDDKNKRSDTRNETLSNYNSKENTIKAALLTQTNREKEDSGAIDEKYDDNHVENSLRDVSSFGADTVTRSLMGTCRDNKATVEVVDLSLDGDNEEDNMETALSSGEGGGVDDQDVEGSNNTDSDGQSDMVDIDERSDKRVFYYCNQEFDFTDNDSAGSLDDEGDML